MAVAQLASFRRTLPDPDIAAESGGNLSAGTIYLKIQFQNAVGYNIGTNIISVTYTANQRIRITFPANYRKSGEEVYAIVISGSPTNSLTGMVQLAKVITKNPDLTDIPLPITVYLSRNAHVATNLAVTAPSNLPTGSDLINGMVREVQSLGAFFEYRQNSTATPDGQNVLSAATGRWHRIDSPSTIVNDTTDNRGADQPLGQIDASELDVPIYNANNTAGQRLRIWYRNGLIPTSIPNVPQGTRLGLQVFLDGVPYSRIFSGRLRIVFRGYVNTDTGDLNTSLPNVNTERVFYHGKSDQMVLPADLPPAHAAVYDIYPQFAAHELDGYLANNSVLSINVRTFTVSAMDAPWAALVGECVLPVADYRRIVPDTVGAIALSGQVLVDNLMSSIRNQELVVLDPNTPNQYLIVNADGGISVAQTLTLLRDTEALRAITSTEAGIGNATAWTSYVTCSNQSLVIDIAHPVAGGHGVIREDYPDVIAGSSKGYFNVANVRVYVQEQSSGDIREYVVLAANASTQQITLTAFNGTLVSAVPSGVPNDFGLYAPNSVAAAASGSGGFDGSYRVAVAYEWDGTALTKISHDPADGCLPELQVRLIDTANRLGIVGGAVADLAALRAVPEEDISPYQRRTVLSPALMDYVWVPTSTETDDTTNISEFALPNWLPSTNPGRWHRVVRDGHFWLTGTGAPTAPTGKIGDMYLDIATGDIYQKTLSGWGSAIYNIAQGQQGPPGDEIELRTNATHIQWKYVSQTTWTDLVALSAITGPQGPQGSQGDQIELRVTTTHIQWKYAPQTTWTNLIALADLEGPQGPQGPQGSPAPTELPEVAQTGNYTLQLSDALKFVTINSSSAATVTIPANSAVAFPVGTQILVGRKGSGNVSIAPASGVNINGATSSLNLANRWRGVVTLWKYGTNDWWVFGGLA